MVGRLELWDVERGMWRKVEVLGRRRLLRVIFRFVSVKGCS